jgi:ABC-type glycerol-3-phosphate transport system substrate-binding protein
MNTTGPWAVTTYREKIKPDSKLYNHWDVGPPPSGPKGRFVWGVPNAWGLNKNGKHVEQSTELLRYLTDTDRSKETGRIGRRVPARKSAGDTFLEPNSVPLHQDVFTKSLAYARSAQVHPTKEDQIADVINAGWEELMLLQKRPPEQVMPEVAAKVNKLLTQP